MKDFHIFLLALCVYPNLCIGDSTTILEDIVNQYHFNESLKNELSSMPEFKECENYTVLKEGEDQIRCFLFYDSLKSLCKNVSSAEEFLKILKKETESTSGEDVCEYFSKMKMESTFIDHFSKNMCIRLCTKIEKRKLISDVICTKSYTFYKYLKNDQNQDIPKSPKGETEKENKNEQEEQIDTKNIADVRITVEADPVVNQSDLKNKKQNDVNTEQNVVNTENKLINSATSQIPTVKEQYNGVIKKTVTPILEGQNKEINIKPISMLEGQNKEINIKPISMLEDQNKEINIKPSSTIGTSNNQRASSISSVLNDPGTAQGQNYPDEDAVYPMDPEKDRKSENPVIETAQENLDDQEDLTQRKFKKPEVSPLSEEFGYNPDISGNSYFFGYFSFTCIVLVIGYVLYHNKQKVIALVVEGRHSRRPRARRPNSANYHKLDCNLEEAISSSVSKNPSHVIY